MDLAIIVLTSLEGRAPSVSGKDAITKRTPGALSPGKSACGEESGGSPKLRHKLRQVGDDWSIHERPKRDRGPRRCTAPELSPALQRQALRVPNFGPCCGTSSAPTKSRARKFAYVEIHVRFGEPMRQRRRIRQAREKATSARHHIDFAAVPCSVIPAFP